MQILYELEWMAKERMKEVERWINLQTLQNQSSAKKKSVSFFSRILTLLYRK